MKKSSFHRPKLAIFDDEEDVPVTVKMKPAKPPPPQEIHRKLPEKPADSLVLIGRALPTIPDEEQGGIHSMKRKDRNEMKPGWQQEVLDDRSRPVHPLLLAHGTTSWNSLHTDTKEGFQPQSFVSSRSNRAKIQQNLSDFMDDEDGRHGVGGVTGLVEAKQELEPLGVVAKREALGEKLLRRMRGVKKEEDEEPVDYPTSVGLVVYHDGSKGLGFQGGQTDVQGGRLGMGGLEDDDDIDPYDSISSIPTYEIRNRQGTYLDLFLPATETGDAIVPMFKIFKSPMIPKDWLPHPIIPNYPLPYDPWPKQQLTRLDRGEAFGEVERPSVPVLELDKETLQAALKSTSTPFTDPLKMQRYRTCLHHSISSMESGGKMDTNAKELEEFVQVARVFRPLKGFFSQRFTTSSDQPINEETGPVSGIAAAKAGRYGVLTRSVLQWYPSRLLCKRFGVKIPWNPEDLPKEEAEAEMIYEDNSKSVEVGNVQDVEMPDQETIQEDKIAAMPDKPSMDIFHSIFGDDTPVKVEVKTEPMEKFKPVFKKQAQTSSGLSFSTKKVRPKMEIPLDKEIEEVKEEPIDSIMTLDDLLASSDKESKKSTTEKDRDKDRDKDRKHRSRKRSRSRRRSRSRHRSRDRHGKRSKDRRRSASPRNTSPKNSPEKKSPEKTKESTPPAQQSKKRVTAADLW